MFRVVSRIVIALLGSTVLFSCGGSDSGGGGANGYTVSVRSDNPDIPPAHTGTTQQNTRFYSVASAGYKASFGVNGLAGDLIVSLGDEALLVDADDVYVFKSTFPAGTNVTLQIEKQPSLQQCEFSGGVDSGVISADTTLQLNVQCVSSPNPSVPVITKIYSASPDTIDLTWEASSDNQAASNTLSYRVWYATNRQDVEDRASMFVTTSAGQLEAQAGSLLADTTYYLAIEAIDGDGNVSDLSEVQALTTIATASVATGTPYHVIDSALITVSSDTWIIPVSAFSSVPQNGDAIVGDTGSLLDVAIVQSVTTVSTDYHLVVQISDISAVIEKLSISSNVSLTESDLNSVLTGTSQKGAPVGGGDKLADDEGRLLPSLSLCRETPETTFTDEQQTTFYIKDINKFTPRVRNNITYSLDPLSPTVGGSIKFEGEVQLGLEVGLSADQTLSGEYICELSGLPLTTTFRYPSGLPFIWVYQEVVLDASIRLSFTGELDFDGSATAIAKATLSGELYYDEASDQWLTTAPQLTRGYETEYELSYAARFNARASLIPSLSTVFYRTATITLSADAGATANVEVDLIPVDDPFYDLRPSPFKLDDFTSYADVKLSLAADLTIAGWTFLDYPAREIYATERLKLFDTPLICTNETTNVDLCEDQLVIENVVGTSRYDLQVYLIDGTNNEVDLSSMKWQVSPDNGFIEVDRNDPRKAVLEVHDQESYTVVASMHGVLGEMGRKYAQFNVNGECQLGLGQPLPPEAQQYFIDDPSGVLVGYIFPASLQDIGATDAMTEVCTEELVFNDIPGVTQASITFYGGQKHGQSSFVRYDAEGELFRDVREMYEHGMLLWRKDYTVDPAAAGNPNFEQHYDAEYTIIPNPNSDYNLSVMTNLKRYSDTYDNDYDGMQVETWDIANQKYINRYFWGNGIERSKEVSRFSPDDLQINADSFTAEFDRGDFLLIYYRNFYINGLLENLYDEERNINIVCGWSDPSDPYYVGSYPENSYDDRSPGDVYHCTEF